MTYNCSKAVMVTIFCLLLFIPKVKADENFNQQHLEVAMRMIGHQVLLNAGDSLSRVLPILSDEDKFRIQFDTSFFFNPDDLNRLVDSILKAANITRPYVLEVEQCHSGDIVYSYEISKEGQSDIVPCRTRDQPRSCYIIVLTFSSLAADRTSSTMLFYVLAVLLLLVLTSLYLFGRKRSMRKDHWIKLGKFLFDRHNSTLILKEQRTELTSKESDLLLLLYNAANTTVERDEILNKVWGDEGDYIGRTLDVFISKLRKKLEADPGIKLVNVRGVGYKLVLDI